MEVLTAAKRQRELIKQLEEILSQFELETGLEIGRNITYNRMGGQDSDDPVTQWWGMPSVGLATTVHPDGWIIPDDDDADSEDLPEVAKKATA